MPSRILSGFVLLVALVLVALVPRKSSAFGEEGAFNPRILLTGTARWEGARTTGPGRWSEELVRRTSAPARLIPTTVRADAPALLAEPFVVWAGENDIPPLTGREVAGLQRFIALGGVFEGSGGAPALSVVLATPGRFDALAVTLRHLAAQTVHSLLEVVIRMLPRWVPS